MESPYMLPAGVVLSAQFDLDGKLIRFNREFQEAIGCSDEALLEFRYFSAIHPDVPKILLEDIRRKLEDKQSWFGVLRFLRPDGCDYWVETQIAPIVISDCITAYVSLQSPATQEQISETEVFYTQIEAGKVKFVDAYNQTNINILSALLFGSSLLLFAFYQVIKAEMNMMLIVSFSLAILGLIYGISHLLMNEFRSSSLLKKQIEMIGQGVLAKPVLEDNRMAMILNVMSVQLAELKANEIELHKREQEKLASSCGSKLDQEMNKLVMRSRYVVMGEMIAMISHQWRQPLAASMLNVEILSAKIRMLSMNDSDKGFLLDRLSMLRDMLMEKSHLIAEFTDFFNPDRELTWFNTLSTVNSVLLMFESSITNASIQVNRYINVNCELFGAEREFKQMILNITKNAIEQLTERQVASPYISIAVSREVGEGVIIEISDNGGGIDEEILPKIFDAYSSTKSLNGAGLGLYMVKMIVFEHFSGSIRAYNSDVGAVFRISIPQYKE